MGFLRSAGAGARAVARARRAFERHDFAEMWRVLEASAPQLARAPVPHELWEALVDREVPIPGLEQTRRLLEAWCTSPANAVPLSRMLLVSLEDNGLPDVTLSRSFADAIVAGLRRCAPSLEEPWHGPYREVLAQALRLAGPAHDAEARTAYEALLMAQPGRASHWVGLGLLHKQGRRFEEAVGALRRARSLDAGDEGTLWQLAVCATGAGDGKTALEAWRTLGLEAELGPDGLPVALEGGEVPVRLTPEATGDTVDALSEEVVFEDVQVEELSPCHGRVRSATLREGLADYGDIVLYDVAPLGSWGWDGDDEDIVAFPQLAILKRSEDLAFRFAALGGEPAVFEGLQKALPKGCAVVPYRQPRLRLCPECLRGHPKHVHRERAYADPTSFGKLVVPHTLELREFAARLQAALAARPRVLLAVPSLYEALGDEVGTRRAENLWGDIEAMKV